MRCREAGNRCAHGRGGEQIVAVEVRPGAAGDVVGGGCRIVGHLVAAVYQQNVGGIDAHALLARHVRQDDRRGGIDHLDVVAALEELHLPVAQGGARGAVVSRGRELDHTHSVRCRADQLRIDVAAVGQETVTTEKVDLRRIGVAVGGTERSPISAGSRHRAAQAQVAVRVDGELCVGVARVSEREADVLQGRCNVVARAVEDGSGCGQVYPLCGIRARGELVVAQGLRIPAHAPCQQHKRH